LKKLETDMKALEQKIDTIITGEEGTNEMVKGHGNPQPDDPQESIEYREPASQHYAACRTETRLPQALRPELPDLKS
jgi:hypothetical protein